MTAGRNVADAFAPPSPSCCQIRSCAPSARLMRSVAVSKARTVCMAARVRGRGIEGLDFTDALHAIIDCMHLVMARIAALLASSFAVTAALAASRIGSPEVDA